MGLKLSLFGLVALFAAIFANDLFTPDAGTSDASPYFSSAWCNPLQPVAAIYTCLAHLRVIGRDIVNPLPPATPKNTKKVAVVTGSNTGIGFETARTLVVDYGWQVVLACRDRKKAIRAMLDINEERDEKSSTSMGEAIVLNQPLDLSSFGSVQLFAKELRERYPKLDVLINNAGRNTSRKSGRLDLLFQSNFLGHFLLTQELLEPLQKTKDGGHVINLSSAMHHFSGTRPMDETYWKSVALYSEERPPETYAASKLAAILFSQELNRRFYDNPTNEKDHASLRSTAVNPGAAASDIWRGFPQWTKEVMKLFFLTPQQASVPVVAAAVHESWNRTSTYLQPYWQADYGKPPFPAAEMLGPYVGYVATTPRLPRDGGRQAAASMWNVATELTTVKR
jgi:NAD(P)-dependent dehydrogenase (short-subunit alcohol dehydrogenase family)